MYKNENAIGKIKILKMKVTDKLQHQLTYKGACYCASSLADIAELRELNQHLRRADHVGDRGKETCRHLKRLCKMLDKLDSRVHGIRGLSKASKEDFEILTETAYEWQDIMSKLVRDAEYAERMQAYNEVCRSNRSQYSFRSNSDPDGRDVFRRCKLSTGYIGCTKLG